jgi:hypothetical protein
MGGGYHAIQRAPWAFLGAAQYNAPFIHPGANLCIAKKIGAPRHISDSMGRLIVCQNNGDKAPWPKLAAGKISLLHILWLGNLAKNCPNLLNSPFHHPKSHNLAPPYLHLNNPYTDTLFIEHTP